MIGFTKKEIERIRKRMSKGPSDGPAYIVNLKRGKPFSKPKHLVIKCNTCSQIIYIPGEDIPVNLGDWEFKCKECGGKYEAPEGFE